MRLVELEENDLVGINGGFWAGVIAIAAILCPIAYEVGYKTRTAYNEKEYYDSLYAELNASPTPSPSPTTSLNTNASSNISPIPRPVPTPSI